VSYTPFDCCFGIEWTSQNPPELSFRRTEKEKMDTVERTKITLCVGCGKPWSMLERMTFTVDSFRELIQSARQHEHLRQILSEAA
jgi:hypothetical protein